MAYSILNNTNSIIWFRDVNYYSGLIQAGERRVEDSNHNANVTIWAKGGADGKTDIPWGNLWIPKNGEATIYGEWYWDVRPAKVEVDINTDYSLLTATNLEKFKAFFPTNKELQAVTIEQVIKHAVALDPSGGTANQKRFLGLSDCNYARAIVVLDCLFVIWGAVGLRWKMSKATVEEVAGILEPFSAEIDRIASKIADAESSTKDKAKAIFEIGKLIYTGGLFEAIYKAIVKSLTWWDMLLYGTLGLAELTAAFATDGLALIAEITAELALLGFVISDSVKWYEACNPTLETVKEDVKNPNEPTELDVPKQRGGCLSAIWPRSARSSS